jgi:hypothetical protein
MAVNCRSSVETAVSVVSRDGPHDFLVDTKMFIVDKKQNQWRWMSRASVNATEIEMAAITRER